MNTDDEKFDYSNHPPSIAELRAERTQSGADWTPRDCLVSILRSIDRGEIELGSVVVAGRPVNGKPDARVLYYTATTTGDDDDALVGMLHRVAGRIMWEVD